MIPKDEDLERGKNYVVVYRIPGEKPKRMVATFLGVTDIVVDRRFEGKVYTFSGRPTFGTTPVSSRYLMSMEKTSEPPHVPRVVPPVRRVE